MGRGGAGGGGGGMSHGSSHFSGGSRSSGHSSSSSYRSPSGGGHNRGGSYHSRPGGPGPRSGYHPPYHSHYHWWRPHRYYGGTTVVYSRPTLGSTIASIVLVLFIMVVAIFVMNGGIGNGGGGITKSTVAREKLPNSASASTEFFVDELGWIDNKTQLNSGMRAFYQETGVHPLLYITDNVDGHSDWSYIDSHIDAFAEQVYDDYIKDEGHLVLVFCEYRSGEWMAAYTVGSAAKTVMDSEALTILMDYIDRYYYSDLNDAQMFAKVFEETGERIMEKTKSPLVSIVLIIGGVAVVFILFRWWKSAKKQKNIEAEQTAQILNSNVEQIPSLKLEDIEKKYE